MLMESWMKFCGPRNISAEVDGDLQKVTQYSSSIIEVAGSPEIPD